MRILFFLCCFFSYFTWADYKEIVGYLKFIGTVTTSFVQENPDGGVSSGVLYLRFPGCLRVDYNQPKVVIRVNKNLLTYHDIQFDETTNVFLPKNDLVLSLLKDPAKISKDEIIKDGNFIYISRANKEKTCTLVLNTKPIKLSSLIIKDANEEVTKLKFYDIAYNKPIDKKLFTAF